jgi:DNA-binding transcriptional LysR family regulator
MDLLAALKSFVRLAETGSFSAVARDAGATQPAISRQISALEEHLGARLVQRSTRSLRLTEDGQDLLVHARHILDAVAEAEAAVGRQRTAPAGLVRLGAPTVFGRLYLAPQLGRLLALYPELAVELALSDDVSDLVQEGLDLALRIGEIADGSLVARRVGSFTVAVLAAPDYLAANGEPRRPEDLSAHECILFTRTQEPNTWRFAGPAGPLAVEVHGRLRVNSIEAAVAAAVAGAGIALLPTWLIRDELASGALQRILKDAQASRRPISLVYPSRRFLAPRTRAVIDFLVAEFRLDPAVSSYGETP